MISKKALFAFALPLSFSAAFAKMQVIPKGEMLLKSYRQNESIYVLKDAKGNLLQKTVFDLAPDNWFNLSPATGAEGIRAEETYKEFGMPIGAEIIVAVIDSGVDVNHEDLQGKIWINSDEIANNGLDDDKNGYIDDVFGWNFIGGSDGMASIEAANDLENGIRLVKGKESAQVNADSLEITRELTRMKKLKSRVEELGEDLNAEQVAYLDKLQAEVGTEVADAKRIVSAYTVRLETYTKSEAILKAAGVSIITVENVRAVNSTDPNVIQAKKDMLSLLSSGLTFDRITQVIAHYSDTVNYHYNEDFNPRLIVGDNYTDLAQKIYGNNDVIGPDSSHGTHVSGIIAATRDNSIGTKGVATNVKIMAVRVVPNGDERDKDVANGIRYAVDNGAKIINMSFGKAYSPYKKAVDEAVRYAESRGVLLVHAAGNDNRNLDIAPSFPSRADKKGSDFSNWLEIGASAFQKGVGLPAEFSNYGSKTVDFFAPGVDIHSTTPDNQYDTYSGTSMATPVVAGVAALILSYEPNLDPVAAKSLMIDTSRRYPNLKVNLPGDSKQILFSGLSIHGTIVDAFEATKVLKN